MKITEVSKEKNMKGNPLRREYCLDDKDNPLEFICNSIKEWNNANAIISVDRGLVHKICFLSKEYFFTSRGGNVYFNEAETEFIKFREDPLSISKYLIVHANLMGSEYKEASMMSDMCSISLFNERKLTKVR